MQTRRAQILTFDAIAEQYPSERFILLMPQVSRHLLTTVPMWSLDVATVKVDPHDEAQAYKIQGDSFGLTKVTLDLLAQAADLTVACKRIDNRADRMFAEYEAWAIMNTPSGGVRGQSRTCEWDGVTAQVKVRAAAVKFVEMAMSKGWSGYKGIGTGQRTQKIEERYNEQWAREQEFGKRMVESKAGNRAVRALLGIKPKYSFDELDRKAFAVVRFVFTPDLEDREIRLMVVGAGLQAQRLLYPSAPLLNAASAEIVPTTLPPVEVTESVAAITTGDMSPTVEDAHDDDDWSEVEEFLPSIYFGMGRLASSDPAAYEKLNKRLTKYTANRDAAGMKKLREYMIGASLIEAADGDSDG